MPHVITYISLPQGRIRGMKVREERMLTKNSGQIDELLSTCWEENLDAGPYAFGCSCSNDNCRAHQVADRPHEAAGAHALRREPRRVRFWEPLQDDVSNELQTLHC